MQASLKKRDFPASGSLHPPKNKNKALATPKVFKPNNNTSGRGYPFEFTVCIRHSAKCQGCACYLQLEGAKGRLAGFLASRDMKPRPSRYLRL